MIFWTMFTGYDTYRECIDAIFLHLDNDAENEIPHFEALHTYLEALWMNLLTHHTHHTTTAMCSARSLDVNEEGNRRDY
jgi:hypothetical protein